METFEPKNLPTEGGKKLHKTNSTKGGFVPFKAAISPSQQKNVELKCDIVEQAESTTSKVDVIEEEGVIKQIIVTCSCGKVTKIDCLYEGD